MRAIIVVLFVTPGCFEPSEYEPADLPDLPELYIGAPWVEVPVRTIGDVDLDLANLIWAQARIRLFVAESMPGPLGSYQWGDPVPWASGWLTVATVESLPPGIGGYGDNGFAVIRIPELSMTVLAHEVGHALGLAHHEDPSNLMHPNTDWLLTHGQAEVARSHAIHRHHGEIVE